MRVGDSLEKRNFKGKNTSRTFFFTQITRRKLSLLLSLYITTCFLNQLRIKLAAEHSLVSLEISMEQLPYQQ